MPNIPDSQKIVTGDGRRKIPDTGESYITQGVQSVAKSLGHVAEQELKIENDRETKSTVQQAHAKHNYIKQSDETYNALANDPDFVNWDVNEIKQKWDELEVKRRSSVVEGVNFYASGSQDVLFAEFDAQDQEKFGQLLELHSQGVDTQVAELWVGVTNKLSGQIHNNPSSENLFGAIYELQAQSEKLSSSLGVEKMQTALRNTTADLVKNTILSLIEKRQFEDAQALLLGEWVDPITRNETSFDNLLGMDTKTVLGELIGTKWQEADEFDVQGLVQAVNRGEAGLNEIAEFRTDNLISDEQSLDLTERAQQVDLERQETQRRADLVQSSRDNGVRLNTNIPDHKRAVDDEYIKILGDPGFSERPMENQNLFTIDFINSTGIVPIQVRRSLRRDRKGSAKDQVRAADLFVKALDLDLNVFPDIPPVEAARLLLINQGVQAGKPSEKAIEDAQQRISSSTSEQPGMREDTYNKLFPNGDPYTPGDVNSSISLEDFVASSINNYTPAGVVFMSDEAKGTLASELNTQFQKLFRLTGDSNLAQDYAEQVVRRDWSATEVNGRLEYMKNAEAEKVGSKTEVVNLDRTNSNLELKKHEQEFEKTVQEEVALPEGSTVSYVKDEQTSLDEEETGKPSYKVVVTDKDGNVVEGPVSMRRLPGEPNEQSYLRYVPGVGIVADSFKSTRIVSGSPGQGFVDASGRVTRSVKNIPGVGYVNKKSYASIPPDDMTHKKKVVQNIKMWLEEPDLFNSSNPFVGTNKYVEDDTFRINEMLSRPATGEEKINFAIIEDVVSKGYSVKQEGNYAHTILSVLEAVEEERNKTKTHSTRFKGPRPLEHSEVAAIFGKLIVKGSINLPDISQESLPGFDDISLAFLAGGINVAGSSISGLGDIIEAVDELVPGAIDNVLLPALIPGLGLLRSGVISKEQLQSVIPEVLSTFLQENNLEWMIDPEVGLADRLHIVGGEIVDFSEKLKPDQQHWITDLAYDTGEVLTKIGISAISPAMGTLVAAGQGANKQKISSEKFQVKGKEKSFAVLGGAITGVAIDKVDKLVKALPEPAKKWFANRVMGNVIVISEKTGVPVDKILTNQGTQLLKDAVEGGVNALITRLTSDPDADIWQGAKENVTQKTWITSVLSPTLTPVISSLVH